MGKYSLMKRVENLELKTGRNIPEFRRVLVDHTNYLEKEKEIEKLENDGFQVIVRYIVDAKDGKPHPDHYEYHQNLQKKKEGPEHGAKQVD